MHCYVHEEKESIGTCVKCGKFICEECNTEIGGKNHCKACVSELVEEQNTELKEQKKKKDDTPIIINNSASSSSSASAMNSGGDPGYPRQSCLIHILLFFFTAGIGNIIYFIYVKHQQSKWR